MIKQAMKRAKGDKAMIKSCSGMWHLTYCRLSIVLWMLVNSVSSSFSTSFTDIRVQPSLVECQLLKSQTVSSKLDERRWRRCVAWTTACVCLMIESVQAVNLIHDTPKWNAKVVYGDTDSLFVYLPGRTKDEAFRIGNDIADAVTAMNPAPMKLKFEKVSVEGLAMYHRLTGRRSICRVFS